MTTIPNEVLARVDGVFRDRVNAGVAPSSVWGVFDTDGLIASGGHGDRGDGQAPDTDTVYRIASCTKSVTAAALLRLVDQGLVALDDPISSWMPAFRAVAIPNNAPPPTLLMLLTMSGGFPTDDPWADRQESISDAELDDVLTSGLLFDSIPGTRFAYSNLGYALIGRVISEVVGRPYIEEATETVLEPLGLEHTRFSAEASGGFVVTGVRPYAGMFEQLSLTTPGAFSPIGGLFSTVADLSAWARYLNSAFTSDASDGPVPAAARRRMQQGVRMMPGTRRPTAYGLGLVVEHDDRFGSIASHSGGYPGFSAHLRWSIDTGIGVVAFENATAARVPLAAEAAHDMVLDAVQAPHPAAELLPATAAARDAVAALIAAWVTGDDRLAPDTRRLFAPNVAMDSPLDRRRRTVRETFAATGADPSSPPAAVVSKAPSHLQWTLNGARGTVRIEIRLAPTLPWRVQTLNVTIDDAEARR